MKKYFIAGMVALTSFSVHAQDLKKAKDKWHFLVEPYLMFPNLNGKTALGQLPEASVNANPGDVFNHLQMGAMLNMEASNNKWTIASDLSYMSLSQDAETGVLISSGKVTMKQFAWEIAGLYTITPWLDAGLGGMLNSIDAGVNIGVKNIGGGTTNRSRDLSKTWMDPMLIARVKSKQGEKFVYMVRGEIGGFGIASKFAWQLQAYAGYRFSKLLQVTAGYRVIGINYEKGSGDNRFLYDMDTFGPVVRLGFSF